MNLKQIKKIFLLTLLDNSTIYYLHILILRSKMFNIMKGMDGRSEIFTEVLNPFVLKLKILQCVYN